MGPWELLFGLFVALSPCGSAVTTCALEGTDCKAVRRGLLTVVGTKVAQGSDRVVHCLQRFYKELQVGACKIVDVNM